jgi:hypothetical protein
VIVSESFGWVVFFIWFIISIISVQGISHPAVLIFLGVLFLLIVWFIGRDTFAGIILRLGNTIELNQNIQTSLGGGRIKRIGLRTIAVESGSGEMFYIPFTRLSSEKIVYTKNENKYKSFEAEIESPKLNSPEETQKHIMDLILFSPYSSVRFSPQVTFLGMKENQCIFKVIIYTLSSNHFSKLMYELGEKAKYINK